jgi:CRP/FNR family transcriptional regulator, cyclic AMP receptor protein
MARRLTDQVRSLALQSVYGRLVKMLSDCSDKVGDVRVVRHRHTQQDIAQRIGASREMVNRVFKELKKGGYLDEQADGRLVIKRSFPADW